MIAGCTAYCWWRTVWVRDRPLVENTLTDCLDFASPVSDLGRKMGLDATTKWPGETQREWSTPIVMDEAVKQRVDAMWGERSACSLCAIGTLS